MLYLGAYSAHLSDRVRDLAWERGYVVAYHGGCTTGICQVNDTDLHAAFELEYQVCEAVTFFEQNLIDPGNIGRTRQQVLDDVVSVWLGLDHRQGVLGHKKNGMSVHLSGSEDHQINRDARMFWDELGFGRVRDEEVARVRASVESGRLRWCRKDVDSLREPFPDNDAGELAEGQEVEGECAEDEPLWEEGYDDDRMSSDSGEAHEGSSCALVPVASELPVEAVDTPQEIEEAKRFADRLQLLETVGASAKSGHLLAVQWHVQREVAKLKKAHRVCSSEKEPSALLRRFVRKRREDEERRLQALRAENRKRNRARLLVKDAARKLRLSRAKAKAKAAASKEALAKLPKEFTAAALGQGHKEGGTRAHCAQREQCLERLRLRAPPLSSELSAIWPRFKSCYAKWIGVRHKEAVGVRLVESTREVMAELGDFLLTTDGKAAKPSSAVGPIGDESAFSRFVRKANKKLPVDASSVLV